MKRANVGLVLFFVSSLFVVLACGGGRVPESLEFPSEVRTLDGLRRVVSDGRAVVLVRPGLRMADFDEILVDPFMVSYSNPRELPRGAVRTLDRETEERFAEVVRDAFVDAMGYSRGFSFVDQPGPKAARVQGWLYDVWVHEPPKDDARNHPLCFSEVTVVLTVRHSQTAQALAQVAERNRLSCQPQPNANFRTVSWRKVRKGVKPWANFLRR